MTFSEEVVDEFGAAHVGIGVDEAEDGGGEGDLRKSVSGDN